MPDIEKGLDRRDFIKRSAGTGAIISALVSWLVGAVVLVIVVAGFLALLPTAPVSAAPEEQAPLECLSCHTRALKGHDKLGEGSGACRVCHDPNNMYLLRLLDKTQVSVTNSPLVCGQCHSKKYQAWEEGTHGILAVMEGGVPVPGAAKPGCVYCHDPHRPQLELPVATKPAPMLVLGEGPLPCLSCHVRVLKGHDKLGSGNKACWVCHDNADMKMLRLADGTRLSLSDSPQVCGQCHQKRYDAWNEGTHGIPAWKEGEPGFPGVIKATCTTCHSPHQPQVALLNITKPHPEPVSPPPSPPTDLIMMVGVSLLLLIGVGFIIRQGEES